LFFFVTIERVCLPLAKRQDVGTLELVRIKVLEQGVYRLEKSVFRAAAFWVSLILLSASEEQFFGLIGGKSARWRRTRRR
jgi:hypothetical protein